MEFVNEARGKKTYLGREREIAGDRSKSLDVRGRDRKKDRPRATSLG